MKKFILSITVVLLFFSTVGSTSYATAIEANDGIQPMAITVEVDKPIYDLDYVSNYELGQILAERDRATTWYTIASEIVFLGNLTPVGIVNSIALALENEGENSLERAYYNGDDLYYAILNANGKKHSLTHEAGMIPSQAPINFVYTGY